MNKFDQVVQKRVEAIKEECLDNLNEILKLESMNNASREMRLKILINNILSEVSKTTNMSTEEYINWLKNEVGFEEVELNDLKELDCLPTPVDFMNEPKVDHKIDIGELELDDVIEDIWEDDSEDNVCEAYFTNRGKNIFKDKYPESDGFEVSIKFMNPFMVLEQSINPFRSNEDTIEVYDSDMIVNEITDIETCDLIMRSIYRLYEDKVKKLVKDNNLANYEDNNKSEEKRDLLLDPDNTVDHVDIDELENEIIKPVWRKKNEKNN